MGEDHFEIYCCSLSRRPKRLFGGYGKMIRYIISFLSGIVTFYGMQTAAIYFFVVIQLIPIFDMWSSFEKEHMHSFARLGDKFLLLDILVIYPIACFATGFVAGMVAKRKEYLMGFLSVCPFYVGTFLIGFMDIYSFYSVITFGLSVALGAFVARIVKKKFKIQKP